MSMTWRIVKWSGGPSPLVLSGLVLSCPECGCSARMPHRGDPPATVVAVMGMRIVFDPPGYTPDPDWMPERVQCPACRTQFTSEVVPDPPAAEGGANVR